MEVKIHKKNDKEKKKSKKYLNLEYEKSLHLIEALIYEIFFVNLLKRVR